MVGGRAFTLVLALAACERSPRQLSTLAVESTVSPDRTQDHSQSSSGARLASLDAASSAVLRQALASKDYATRLIAVEALGRSKVDAVMPWLEHALGDPEHDVRMTAVEALDRMHSTGALTLLATVRDDTSEDLDIRALAASAFLEAR